MKSLKLPGWKHTVAGMALGLTIAASLSPAEAQSEEKTITAVMSSALRVLDPVMTTANITRNHAYMIYDVLVAVDKDFVPRPQMADWTVSDDKLTYTFTLRDGLTFHDGAPVTSADVVASLKRWAQRDSGGQLVFDATESLEPGDVSTVVWKLKSPFPALLDTIAKQSGIPAFIMPERIAAGSAFEAITDHTGSGPFVFDEDEHQPGISVTYRKFEEYVPRDEPASWMAGGKNVKVDTVRWVTMPDAQTAINALMSGEVDYVEQIQVDLLPIIESNPDVVAEVRDSLGNQTIARMNFKQPPFDNKKIRQAAMMALNQQDVMAAMIGNADYYTICGSVFGCGTPFEDETGAGALIAGGDAAAAKALLQEAGYDDTPVVVLQATDVVSLKAQPVIVAQALRNAGFNVDLQAMDWQSIVQRRPNQSPPSQGGWNIFFTNWLVPDINTPLNNTMLVGRGDDGWFGWPVDETVEQLRAEFIAADGIETQTEIASRIQAHAMDEVLYVPLGQYSLPQGRSAKLVNMIPSPVPVFWEIEKAD